MLLVLTSGILIFSGTFIAWWSNRNLLSPIVITMGVFFLFYIGGLFFWITQGHALTPYYVALGTFSYGLGAFLLVAIKRVRPSSERQIFSELPFCSIFPLGKNYFISLIIVSLFSVLLGAMYFYEVGIPLFTEWSSFRRTEAIAGRGLYIRSLFSFLPVAALSAFFYQKYRGTLASKALMWLLLFISCLYIILYGSRGGAIAYIMPFVFGQGVISTNKATYKAMILIIVLLLAGLFLQYSYYGYSNLPLSKGILVFIGRLTAQQVEGLDYLVYNVVPQRGLYLGRIHIMGFKGMLATFRIIPYEVAPVFGEILFRMKAGKEVATRFTLVTTTFGDLYADFGPFGIFVGMFIYGLITQYLYICMIRGCKDHFLLAFFCYLQYVILAIHIGGDFFGVLASKGISLAIFLIIIFFLYVVLSLPSGRVFIVRPLRAKIYNRVKEYR